MSKVVFELHGTLHLRLMDTGVTFYDRNYTEDKIASGYGEVFAGEPDWQPFHVTGDNR